MSDNEFIKLASPGSQVHQAAAAQIEAQTAVDEFQKVVDTLEADLAANRAIVASVDWTSNLTAVRDAMGSLAALEKMREAARVEMKSRQQTLRLADKHLFSLVNQLENHQALVKQRTDELELTTVLARQGQTAAIASLKDYQPRLDKATADFEGRKQTLLNTAVV